MLEIIQSTTAIIAIIIAICTLRQSAKQIEQTTRPYISIYARNIHMGSPYKILVIKNNGNSSAKINYLKSDYNLEELSYIPGMKPFSRISESSFAPNQSQKCYIFPPKSKDITINFEISYKSTSNKTYTEQTSIRLDAEKENTYTRYNSENKDMKYLICSIQQLVEDNL